MSPADIFRDFRRNYNNCYVHVQFPDNYERHLFQIVNIEENDHPQMILNSTRFGNLVLNVGSDYRILFPTAITGVFQCGKEAYIATRHFGTGYTRGINTSNTRFIPVLEQYCASVHGHTQEQLIDNMFRQQYLTLSEGIKLLETSDYLSVALTRSFSLCPSICNSSGFSLFNRGWPIAELSKTKEVVTIHNPVFALAVKRFTNAN